MQVSVTAEQNSRLLTWSSSRLRQYLNTDSHLLAVFKLIIGNDIASKLFSTKYRPQHTAAAFVSVPATRSLSLQLNFGDNHRPIHTVHNRPGRPEQLPLKSPRLPSLSGETEYFTCLCMLNLSVIKNVQSLFLYCLKICSPPGDASGICKLISTKTFELLLTRRAKAYSSSCSQTVSLSSAISSQFILGVCAAAKNRKNQ